MNLLIELEKMKACRVVLLTLVCVTWAVLADAADAADAAGRLDLAGRWHCALDRDDQGERDGWWQRALPEPIQLPGSLAERGFGDDISINTAWTGSINDRRWFTAERYAPYRQPGNVKVPFWLQPEKSYVGVAWYQRDVVVPKGWQGRRIVATFERAHWVTTLWLDDAKMGSRDGLGTPHEYDLGVAVAPGRHRLTLRVDNRPSIAVGADAHSISDHTQGNWNGVAGRLELRATDPVWFADVRVFPLVSTRQARVVIQIGNATGRAGAGTLRAAARSFNGPATPAPAPAPVHLPVRWGENGGQVELVYELGLQAPRWDEFSPALHEMTLEVPGVIAPQRVVFGLREIDVAGRQLRLNGRTLFLRGTLECCIFPLTGYPPTDVAAWTRILQKARAHGLNHLRFHSWCPPEAAFTAADKLGFYFQVECSAWSGQFNKGGPIDPWIYDESERIVAANGNHPSFLLMAASNEPGGPGYERFLDRWVDHWKRRDDRRLYTAGSGWPHVSANDFDVTAESRAYPVRSAADGRNDGDYRAFLDRRARPVISHEIGQYCVFPNLDEIRKYRGLLKARNFEIVSDFLTAAGMRWQARGFLRSSGQLQALFYKDEIEACLRTPGWSGFQLLDLHDFPGQGTALVGVLDAFWDEKGYLSPAEYRRFCNETVLLARLPKRLWTCDERLRAGLEVAHYGAQELPAARLVWRLREAGGRVVAGGECGATKLPTGRVSAVGDLDLPLGGFSRAAALKLELRLAGTRLINDWNLWVYPAHAESAPPANVRLATALDAATLAALEHGDRVVLLLDPKRVSGATVGRFDPIFWNKLWFPNQPQHTLGLLMNPKHPALAQFPTAFHSDWQWQDLQNRSKPVVLDHLPRGLRPIVQVIDDWNSCRKLGLVFEARVGLGRLLVCSLDLESDLARRPAARQLRASLLGYVASDRFQPEVALDAAQVHALAGLTTPPEPGAVGR